MQMQLQLHYIAQQYTTLYYTNYTALRYNYNCNCNYNCKYHYIALHDATPIALHHTTTTTALPYTTLDYTTLYHTTVHNTTVHYNTLH